MKIDSRRKFKDTFNKLFKKYHPDNQETGDAKEFIRYRDAYLKAIEMGALKDLPQDILTITTTQAFTGTTLDYNNVGIIIPSGFYKSSQTIVINDSNGKPQTIRIEIVPSEPSESFTYKGPNMDMLITKTIHVNPLEAMVGGEKIIDVLGEKVTVEYQPNALFKRPVYELKGKGFWKRVEKARGDVIVKFFIDMIDLTKEDRKVLEGISKKYGK